MLTWTVEGPKKSVVFLDLQITIVVSRFVTRTYQKPLNLYLYLAKTSNYRRKLFEAVIYGLVQTYRTNHTYYAKYIRCTKLLYARHLERIYQ